MNRQSKDNQASWPCTSKVKLKSSLVTTAMAMEGVEVKVEVDVYEDHLEEEEGLGFFGLAEQQLADIISPSMNRNLYLVPEDLQQLIIESNPGRAKFTVSQRLNTQLVLDDYILKKKLGPEMRKGCRVVRWICLKKGCLFSVTSHEGNLVEGKRQHNHPVEPELYEISQAKAQLREGLERYLATTRNESPETFIPEVSESVYRAITHCDYEGILKKNCPENLAAKNQETKQNVSGVTIVKKETIEPVVINFENEEDPLSSPQGSSQGYSIEDHGFVSIPSMFGGTKLVPKVPNSQSGTKSSKCSGRRAFSKEQIDILEEAFQHSQYPDSHLKMSLAQHFDLPVARVQNWFTNRRAQKTMLDNRQQTSLQVETSGHLEFGGVLSGTKSSSKMAEAEKNPDNNSSNAKVQCKGCGIGFSQLRRHLKNNDKCSGFYSEGDLDQYLKDKKKIQNKKQYQKDPEKVLQKKREEYQKDPEKVSQKRREEYERDPEKFLDRNSLVELRLTQQSTETQQRAFSTDPSKETVFIDPKIEDYSFSDDTFFLKPYEDSNQVDNPPQFGDRIPEENLTSPPTLAAINPSNRSLVSEDLQQLILATNPGRVKFTASQRLNTQLVLDEFVLKKKKGSNLRQVRVLSQGTEFELLWR